MTSVTDDRPHPIPPYAYLRYKENYVFFILSPETGVFGCAHFNNEPAFDRSRAVCNLSVDGQQFDYGNARKLPADFAGSEALDDGRCRIAFEEPHQRFRLSLDTDEVEMEAIFVRRFETFDYHVCRTDAPGMASFQEVVTLGLNLPYNHQQQALTVTGRIRVKATGKEVAIDGFGYRDHSRVFRGDNLFLQHTWCGIHFPDRAFGVKTGVMTPRLGHWCMEGYVADKDGARALTSISTSGVGEGPDGQPATFRHVLTDVLGQDYVIEHDLLHRHAHVPLLSEHAGDVPPYFIVENCCPSTLVGTGAKGVAVVELGRQHAVTSTPDRPLFTI